MGFIRVKAKAYLNLLCYLLPPFLVGTYFQGSLPMSHFPRITQPIP